MVQSILFFLLGFLCAGFIALLIAPPIWRRAVKLTNRRLEAALPLTRAELQADKDRVRAEFAMQARRLEMTIAALQETEAGQKVEIARLEQRASAIDADKAGLSQTISALEDRIGELTSQIGDEQAKAAKQDALLAGMREKIRELEEEIGKLARQYEEASFLASSRQIELVGRESELDKQAADIAQLRSQMRDMEQRAREAKAQADSAREALKVERERSAGLDDRVQRLLSTVADRDEKLERRERELARMRDKGKAAEVTGSKRAPARASTKKRKSAQAKDEAQFASLKAGSERLERQLMQENVSGAGKDAELREQMAALAAEVVHMTAVREGTASPIAQLLSATENTQSGTRSLAERVRSLQETGTGS
ncbi:hypothetical protein [Aquamicrobium defluvii]|uniref:Chromosome segregation ATPase n=1 Tax=Aquamicrobium defluvii TaxID=69279 RepID=A0A011UEY4_9HYPH|nr:hypothetical protein [Aquamicrobium defluvii]EXL04458.1 hypothetical protein BG36_10055 [Aquamicrobium defluvii]EZQ14124.1 hypothetical protein CF98_21265 [Halopseudomonas bauzanensis]TDR34469.1 hypothetical protein DES43_11475 [Aquamicrobium defluvii]